MDITLESHLAKPLEKRMTLDAEEPYYPSDTLVTGTKVFKRTLPTAFSATRIDT